MASNRQTPLAIVADDDASLILVMEQALRNSGFDVISVNDGADAVRHTVRHQPDIVFLDINMPGMNGLDACGEIRASIDREGPAIVMVAGADSEDSISAAFAAGANDYMIKPVNWSLFSHRLQGWLGAVIDPMKIAETDPESFLVSGRGDILGNPGRRAADGKEAPQQDIRTLAELWPEPAAKEVMKLVRKVLKTRAAETCRVPIDEQAQHYREIRLRAKGVNKVSVTIEPIPGGSQQQSQMYRLAYLDPITRLPNRHLFELTMKERLVDAKLKSLGLSLLCLTFDGLVDVRPGQQAVQQLLGDIADRLVATLRDTDRLVCLDTNDTCSRPVASFDGGHFLMLLDDPGTSEVVNQVLTRINEACSVVAADRGLSSALTPRLGVARFPTDGEELDLLIDAATLAGREACESRLATPRYYSGSPTAHIDMRLDLAAEIRDAMATEQFHLCYQPRIDLQDGSISGAEALLRWQHPLRGTIAVAEFLEAAASSGELARLSDWALRRAAEQAKEWTGKFRSRIPISVNICQEQVIRPDFSERVLKTFEDLALDPASIELEVDEGCLDCTDTSLSQLAKLRDNGVGLTIDDFGSSRINLLSLRRLRIDGFKVNHSHARIASFSGDHSGIYSIVAAIARSSSAIVVAKGIESAAELRLVDSRGCDHAQGFHICQPLSPPDFARYVEESEQSPGFALKVATAI